MKKNGFFYGLGGILFVLVLWHIGAAYLIRDAWLLPTPVQVFTSFVDNASLIWQHSLYTLAEAGMGIAIAVVVALLIAWMMAMWQPLAKMFYPLLLGSQMVPIIVLAPIFLIWFGYGMLPKVLVAVIVCFFPVAVNTLAGLRSVDAETIAFYRSMGASRSQLFRLIHLPAAMPYFFGGLRVAATYSIMGAVIGEWLGAQAGLGLLLIRAQRAFDLSLVFAAILAIIFWSALVFGLVWLAEYYLLRWQRMAGEGNL